MNEQIKKLIGEAGISISGYYRNLDNPAWSYSKGIVAGWSEDFKQQINLEPYIRIKEMDEDQLSKFVELVVKECAKVANDNFDKGFCPVGDFIKEHFGVK